MRSRKKSFKIIILILIFSITIGYSLLNSTLNITGTSNIKKNTWDIHIENIKVAEGSVSEIKEPTVDNNNLSLQFEVTLDKPGDFYEITFDVVNDGTIDAMIDVINQDTNLNEEHLNFITAAFIHENNIPIVEKQLVKANEFIRYKIITKYNEDIVATDLPSDDLSIYFNVTFDYSQADETAVPVLNNGAKGDLKIISGDLNTLGSEFCIGTECFYVLYSNEEYVATLAKYNLYVGNELLSIKELIGVDFKPISDANGMQNPIALGYHIKNNELMYPMYGGFSYKESYDSELYSESDIKFFVDDYINIISRLGYSPLAGAILDLDSLESLGCNLKQKTCTTSQYPWLYSTSYWTMTPTENDSSCQMYVVAMTGDIMEVSCNIEYAWGIRPVLIFDRAVLTN